MKIITWGNTCSQFPQLSVTPIITIALELTIWGAHTHTHTHTHTLQGKILEVATPDFILSLLVFPLLPTH